MTAKGLTAKGAAAIDEIKRAGDWGLDPKSFMIPNVPVASDTAPDLPRDQAARAEIDLTLAVLTYANHARGGRIPDPAKQLSSFLDRLPQLRDPRTILAEVAKADDPAAYLRGLHPKHAQFEKLRQRYLELQKAAGATSDVIRIPAGPLLKPGLKHPHVALIRQRLKAASAPGGDDTLFDPALVEAVKAFQKEKGQSADGYVGNATRAAFNDFEVPSTAKLLANMEAWRWIPDDLGALHITVNVPEFMIRVVKDGTVIHEERVITGLVDKQTPVFSDEMELVTIHPRWNVPPSIKVRELYPSLARGSNPIQRQGLKLMYNGRPVDPMEVDWSSTDIRRYEVFQPPGGTNVLGVVKFSFPNKHLVYMHDTSSRNLFEESSRPFSHGCMRVRNPVRLAEIVLGADKGWDAARVQSLIDAPLVENPIALDKKVPVHVTYFTSVIGPDGKEQLYKDVYGHEQRMTQALAGEWSKIAVGPDHLAPVTYGAARYESGTSTIEKLMTDFFGGF